MIGLYYLPMPTLMHEIGITLEGASEALRRVSEVGFAFYDTTSEYVWVPEMAAQQIAETLKAADNRVKGVISELKKHSKSPFFNKFVLRYGTPFNLKIDLISESPLEGPSKPLRSQEQEQEQEIEQEQEQEDSFLKHSQSLKNSSVPIQATSERTNEFERQDFQKFWGPVEKYLRSQVVDEVFQTLYAGMRILDMTSRAVVVAVPQEFLNQYGGMEYGPASLKHRLEKSGTGLMRNRALKLVPLESIDSALPKESRVVLAGEVQ